MSVTLSRTAAATRTAKKISDDFTVQDAAKAATYVRDLQAAIALRLAVMVR